MKTDTLFYKLLEAQPALLLHMAHLDSLVDVPYHFQSVELKEKAHVLGNGNPYAMMVLFTWSISMKQLKTKNSSQRPKNKPPCCLCG